MKWRNHAIMAASIAVMMQLYPAEILYCASFAGLPDQLESIGRVRILAHRTWTHEVFVWLVPLLVFYAFPNVLASVPRLFSIPVEPNFQRFFMIRTWVLFLPGLLHLAGDILTPMGIRVATRKVSLGLFTTGSFLEYLVAGLFVIAALFFRMG
ncbi:metal-dependent hydrolase [Desulforhabdus amnigena]|uniref:Metal-dependent hydrolase n=1 Tax=Desulforhabdus amnigena TaxID=40218 RepID=A0A9W6FSU0_9BACT|nr:metal-dependent hydrolase [Desulforhabdus amnigena]NLJ29304.1 hypothetical protein [Deltaproteobacteria bacterium]GLI34429.1 hypothetical protein DAMNIGENAA_18620 [Desulforhabdus amnigena]